VTETPHTSLDPRVPALSLNPEILAPSFLGSFVYNKLAQYHTFLPTGEGRMILSSLLLGADWVLMDFMGHIV
jgi:hypothetical protein